MIIVCTATASAPALSLAPILRAMADAAPNPNPIDMAMIRKKKGKKNPTADSASAPRPDTQIPSAILYIAYSDIAAAMGRPSFMMAFFGSPKSVLTPSVSGVNESIFDIELFEICFFILYLLVS